MVFGFRVDYRFQTPKHRQEDAQPGRPLTTGELITGSHVRTHNKSTGLHALAMVARSTACCECYAMVIHSQHAMVISQQSNQRVNLTVHVPMQSMHGIGQALSVDCSVVHTPCSSRTLFCKYRNQPHIAPACLASATAPLCGGADMCTTTGAPCTCKSKN